jgi:tetratricopeptide (TPR) repeat protein
LRSRIHIRLYCALLLLALVPAGQTQERAANPVALADQHLARAEAALREQEKALAESEYRFAAEVALTSLGLLDLNRGEFASALLAFGEASEAVADARQSILNLSLAHLRQGKPEEAVPLLRDHLLHQRADLAARRVLAQALNALGRTEEATWELKDALDLAPENSELLYSLASSQLALRQVEEAGATFDRLKKLRPGAATHVLVGRTYRDFGHYRQAEEELRRALQIEPGVRRAHYYLGTIYLQGEGSKGLEEAPLEFERELRKAPGDYLANSYLGMARVALRSYVAAIPPLKNAIRAAPHEAAPHFFLGQAYSFTGNRLAAVRSLSEYVRLATASSADADQLGNAHYLLAQSFRRLGKEAPALKHFARAQELKAEKKRSEQERLRQFLVNESQVESGMSALPLADAAGPRRVQGRARAEKELRSQLKTMVARAYFNLGTLQAQEAHFQRAAHFFQRAARWQAEFPSVQYSLGLALYNAQQYAEAIPALERVVQQEPANARAQRLLGLSCFQAGQYDRAAAILAGAQAEADSSLLYTLGVSLARSGRAGQAADVFAQLLRSPSTSPDVLVLMGQVHAQQQDYDGALALFQRALELNPGTPDAHYSAGQIHLRSGRLPEAEQEFRQELQARPDDARTRYHLAYVLEQQQRAEEAMPLLAEVVRTHPSYADARYLMGKILMDRGQPGEAAEQLEAAVGLAPDKPHLRYQLGQAYQKLGRLQEAEREFVRFRELRQEKQEQP